jgi:hypothetical protein
MAKNEAFLAELGLKVPPSKPTPPKKINKAQLKEMLNAGGMLHVIETYPEHAEEARAYMNKKVVSLSFVLVTGFVLNSFCPILLRTNG